jgi:hypothetical protein
MGMLTAMIVVAIVYLLGVGRREEGRGMHQNEHSVLRRAFLTIQNTLFFIFYFLFFLSGRSF